MILLRLLLILAICAGSAWGANPSPRSKSLKIGALTYGSSTIWTNSAARTWWANRFYCGVGSAGTSSVTPIADMKAINPELTFYRYVQYSLPANDTVYVKSWASANGFSSDSLFLRVSNSVDSFRVRTRPFTGSSTTDGTSAFSWWRTTQPGRIIVYSGFTNSQTRFAWDYRNPKVGYYLAQYFDAFADSAGCDGVMIDEWNSRGSTDNAMAGLDFPDIPTIVGMDDASNRCYHPVSTGSSIYTGLQRNWDSTFDLNTTGGVYGAGDANGTHSYVDVLDSLRRLYAGWAKMLGDSSRIKYGKELMINPANSMGNYNSLSNWNAEGRTLIGQWIGGQLMGENCFYSPSISGQVTFLENAETCIASLRDSSVRIAVWPIRVNPDDSSAADLVSIGRMRHVGLGFMLQCSYPGNSDVIFCFKSLIKVNWGLDTCYGASNGDADCTDAGENPVSDTITTWDEAWGKYFGVYNTTRNVVTGTDGAGQSYKLRHGATKKVNGDTLCVWVGKYANGNNRAPSSTNTTYTLTSFSSSSGDTYYELLPGGTWSATTKQEGDTVHIANAMFRFFFTDTALANAGVASTPSPSLLVDSVHNDAIGELDTLQTRATASASMTAGDSLIVVYSLVSFAACDSSSGANSIRRSVPTAGVQYTDTFVLTNSETYTLYCAAWHWNATTGWSTRVQTSRTYTAAAPPPVASGQLIKWIRRQ